ncbi:WYL domain-containing protein, partial [Nonomuraea sp. NPDC049784]|uniref:WYL domain-containing protein n=1 Tax=Nonomuraea sp. NPDC049784 TaxID=3154361 RepID=UPI0033C9919E
LWEAVRDRRVVRFDYRGAGSENVRARTVEPWGVVSRNGRWYIAGFDRDRDAPRVFRLSRITGQVAVLGRAGAFEVPEGVDLRDMVGFPDDSTDERVAVVRVRRGTCEGLRQLARAVREADGGWDEAELTFSDPERLAGWMASLGSDVEVVEPPDAREAVIRRLKGAMAS